MIEQLNVHEEFLERFTKLIQKDRLAHAYLLVGPKHIGKSETALAMAKLVNCTGQSPITKEFFCDQCSSCVKINKRFHPDVHMVEAEEEGKTIKIEQIREVLSQSHLRPYEAQKKVFIIKDIHNMTPEAGNALLKTLEEPSANSLLLLTTSVLEKNLDTIVSRCHVLYCLSASKDKLEANLKKYYDVGGLQAAFFAKMAEGSWGHAKELVEAKFFEKKNGMIDLFILSRSSDDFIKQVTADKESVRELLAVLLSWMHDSLLLKTGAEEKYLVHVDRMADLQKFVSNYAMEDLNDLYEAVVKTVQLLEENLNVKIQLMIIKSRLSGTGRN